MPVDPARRCPEIQVTSNEFPTATTTCHYDGCKFPGKILVYDKYTVQGDRKVLAPVKRYHGGHCEAMAKLSTARTKVRRHKKRQLRK